MITKIPYIVTEYIHNETDALYNKPLHIKINICL